MSTVKNALINLVLSEEWGELKKEILNITLMCIKPIWGKIRYCDSNKACIGEEVPTTYELTSYYYSDDWLTGLSPGGEERNKPHVDRGVHQAYLNALDRLVRYIKEASNGGFCDPLRAIKVCRHYHDGTYKV
ncbi:hypothetical protein Peur_074584 [Populus x canadensis]